MIPLSFASYALIPPPSAAVTEECVYVILRSILAVGVGGEDGGSVVKLQIHYEIIIYML